ncbi:MAG: hypothetical protein IPF54_20545 [Draconibacterium sp.]|nr:hypothetical protein [Draconibacterium sp.]
MSQFLKLHINHRFILNLFASFAGRIKMPNLKFYLSDDKSSYAGMLMVNQIWTRYIMNNPDINGVEQYGDFDIGFAGAD